MEIYTYDGMENPLVSSWELIEKLKRKENQLFKCGSHSGKRRRWC
jgi:hypothetical protein